ncbi:glycosyltransferase family 4 protein [Bacillus coagulans]|nr:glycosyltransferase family 4 protein [Heyndrickxia coagulans]
MRIMLVTLGKVASGAEKVTSILYEEKKENMLVVSGSKIQLDYYSGKGFNVSKLKKLQSLDRKNFKINNVINVLGALIPLRKTIRKYNPTYIHVNNIPSLLYVVLSTIGLNIPIVLQVHDFYSKDKLVKFIAKFIKNKPSLIVAVSDSVKSDLIDLKFPYNKIRVIHNGIIDKNETIKRNTRKEFINILFIGTISEWKGLHILMKAVSLLKYDIDSLNIYIAGPFLDESYKNEIKQLAKKVPYKINYLGKINDTKSVMENMDILVHCSIEKDPFPTVVLEGLAAGMAVIGSSAGGAKEVIIDGDTGLLHTPGNFKELSEKLKILIDKPDLRNKIAQNGFNFAMKNLDKETYKKNFFNSITNLINISN